MKTTKLFALAVLILVSCHKRTQNSKQNAKSFPNAEINKVLKYYSLHKEDSLKLKAAKFLISNLKNRHYFDGKLLTKYMGYSKLVLRDRNHGEYIMKSFNKVYGPFSLDSLEIKANLSEIHAEKFISNIDCAFQAWRAHKWAKNYTFDAFCHFVLPYTISNEVPSYERRKIYNQFDSFLNAPGTDENEIAACTAINNRLIKDGWLLTSRAEFYPHSRASTLIENRAGACREMVDLGIYVMRAVGIPVTYDFLPQWPYRRQGHSWNVLIGPRGEATPFLAAESNPGTPHKPRTKKGKVYRSGFVENPYSLAMVAAPDEVLPDFLNNTRISDVTEQYAKVHSLTLDLDSTSYRTAYLAVFNDNRWIPIAWSRIKTQKATFTKVEGGIAYLPIYYDQNGATPAKDPFILSVKGGIKYLKSNSHLKQTMLCHRVYPIVPDSYLTERLKGVKIQGSNRTDFSDAETLFTFSNGALPGWNDIPVSPSKKLRYYRLISAGNNVFSLAEIRFFDKSEKQTHALQPTRSDQRQIMDNDSTTSFSTGRIGRINFDFGKRTLINKVLIMPKIKFETKNSIVVGSSYSLMYWNNNRWTPHSTQIARKDFLVFRNVPTGALYRLCPKGHIDDARIFTYVHGKQVWW